MSYVGKYVTQSIELRNYLWSVRMMANAAYHLSRLTQFPRISIVVFIDAHTVNTVLANYREHVNQ